MWTRSYGNWLSVRKSSHCCFSSTAERYHTFRSDSLMSKHGRWLGGKSLRWFTGAWKSEDIWFWQILEDIDFELPLATGRTVRSSVGKTSRVLCRYWQLSVLIMRSETWWKIVPWSRERASMAEHYPCLFRLAPRSARNIIAHERYHRSMLDPIVDDRLRLCHVLRQGESRKKL